MRRPWIRTIAVAVALAAGVGALARSSSTPADEKSAPVESLARFQAGVCWVGAADVASVQYLKRRGARWISVTPFGYGQKTADTPPANGFLFSRFHGESVEGVREVIRAAKREGVAVLLKPHLWFHTRDGKWLADIAMQNDEDWQRWFSMYWDYMRPFVEMARDERVEVLCVGTELGGSVAREKEWRALIAQVRAIYSGLLTYAANWDKEYKLLPFWDALDLIGVQAYFPLVQEPNASVQAIADAWRPWIAELAAQSKRWELPVLFTELGYRPVADATARPWEWSGGEPEPAAQERAFAAARLALDDCSWLRGVYIWKWFAPYTGREPGTAAPAHPHDGFSPQGRPAEDTIFQWFRAQRVEK